MFFAGLCLFALASVLSGVAQDPAMLVTSRFLQCGGEALARPAAIGIFGGMGGLGGILDPIVWGLLLQASWRLIFPVNVPITVAAMLAVARLVDESRAERNVSGAGLTWPAPHWSPPASTESCSDSFRLRRMTGARQRC